MTHLDAIELRLSNTRIRRDLAKTQREREWFEHEVRMIERERDGECDFLGIERITDEPTMTLDEILAELAE